MPQSMYVANATKQTQIFTYSIPEVAQPRQQTIEVGKQIRISGNLTPTDIEAIIQQHAKYGLIDVSEIGKGRRYVPMCFSLDTPVPAEKIDMLIARNAGVLDERGHEMREQAALTLANQMGNRMREVGAGIEFGSVELELTEDDDAPSRARRSATGDKRMEEVIVANREGRQPRRTGRNRG